LKVFFDNAKVFFLFVMLSVNASAEHYVEPQRNDQYAHQAKLHTGAFAKELKAALVAALQAGGPVEAIEVCNMQALPIAKSISAQSGWTIKRTSLRLRNQANKPDEWEMATLLQFEQRKAAGENISTITQEKLVSQEGEMLYRYMQAIPTTGVCVSCHGDNLGGDIAEKLEELYPNDSATGFNLGDIRGAFSLQKNIKEPSK